MHLWKSVLKTGQFFPNKSIRQICWNKDWVNSVFSQVQHTISDIDEAYKSCAQDRVVSQVMKAKNIIRTVGIKPPPTQQLENEKEEEYELCKRVIRKERSGLNKYPKNLLSLMKNMARKHSTKISHQMIISWLEVENLNTI